MPVLQKLDIIMLGRLKTETLAVDGGEIIVSEMGAVDSFALFTDRKYQDKDGVIVMAAFAPALLVRSLVDDAGARLFTDTDEAAVSRLPSRLFNDLVAVAMRINGMSDAAHSEQIKNSEPSPD